MPCKDKYKEGSKGEEKPALQPEGIHGALQGPVPAQAAAVFSQLWKLQVQDEGVGRSVLPEASLLAVLLRGLTWPLL